MPFKLSKVKVKPRVVGRTRNYSYGKDWRNFSATIKEERGRSCQICGSKSRLEDHHIIPLSKGGPNNRANIKVLCYNCHHKQH